ncbi:hypothetical protein R5R35_012690 [Gryllus longicercus]|uniref:Accessory gland protein n=1 Tax=Gryllus longicercus TaxID=2509291 RepID=A0AAN9V0Y3_9ORTH
MQAIALQLLCAALLLPHARPFSIPKPGTYKAIITSVGKCDAEGTGELKVDWRMTHTEDSAVVVNGVYNWPYDLDDQLGAVIDIAQWSDNSGWLPHFYKVSTNNYCAELKKKLPSYFKRFIQSFGVKPHCPLPKGRYELKNWSSDITDGLPFPMLPFGKYMVDSLIFRQKKQIGCFRFECEIQQK